MNRIGWLAALVVLIFAVSGSAQDKPKDWDDSYYTTMTLAEFTAWRPALQPIDLKNINHELLSAAIFYETNRARVAQKKKPFLYSPALREGAFGHARDMAEKDFHSHENPDDPKKRTLAQRLALVGIEKMFASENIAFFSARQYPVTKMEAGSSQIRIDPGPPPATYTYIGLGQKLVDGWMLSRGHRENILADNTPYLGCGAYPCQVEMLAQPGRKIAVDYFKVCQDFASRRGPDKPKPDK